MKEQGTQWDEWRKTIAETDKKVWIVTAAVLVILLAAAFVVMHGLRAKNQGQEVLCPYQWEQKATGELVLTVDASAAGDAEFSMVTAEDAGEMLDYQIRQSGSRVRCTFRGTEMGVTQVTLLCQRTEPVAETVCQIRLVLSIQEDLSVAVAEDEETEAVTYRKVEADNTFPCYYIPYTEGSTPLELRILQADENWEYRTEGDVMTVSPMRYEGVCYLGILSREALTTAVTEENTEETAATGVPSAADEVSEARVMLYNTVEDVQYTFVLSVRSDHTLAVKSATAGKCEITEEGDSFLTMDMSGITTQ